MPHLLTPQQKNRYFEERRDGATMREAIKAKGVSISLSSARTLEADLKRKQAERTASTRSSSWPRPSCRGQRRTAN